MGKNMRGDGKLNEVALSKDYKGPKHNHSLVLMPDGTINVSQSKVKSWRNCHRQYHNKYVLGLRKKIIKRPFKFGTIVHKMVEADAEGDDPFEVLDAINLKDGTMFRKQQEVYGEIIADVRDIMTDYFKYWAGDLRFVRRNGRSSEHEFRIEIEPGLWFTGKIDAVGKRNKLTWLVEHKTFARMPNADDRWQSVQSAVYIKAWEMMGGVHLDGTLWDYVSSKPPQVPTEVLKSGAYSTKRIHTVPAALARWIRENKLNRADFVKLRNEAKANLDQYFIRIPSPLRPAVVESTWIGFIDTARDIAENHGGRSTMNIGRHCSWCDYRDLCKAEVTGSDAKFVMRREFTTEPEEAPDTDREAD